MKYTLVETVLSYWYIYAAVAWSVLCYAVALCCLKFEYIDKKYGGKFDWDDDTLLWKCFGTLLFAPVLGVVILPFFVLFVFVHLVVWPLAACCDRGEEKEEK